MKITRVWATPVRPPAHHTVKATWLSESLVADPMSIYPLQGQLSRGAGVFGPGSRPVLNRIVSGHGITCSQALQAPIACNRPYQTTVVATTAP